MNILNAVIHSTSTMLLLSLIFLHCCFQTKFDNMSQVIDFCEIIPVTTKMNNANVFILAL